MQPQTSAPGQADPPPAPILELRRIVKDYGAVRAVDGISLSLRPGEFLSLLGPSGCGKTTVMNMIAGFFPPSSGAVMIDGRDVTMLKPHRRDLGMVFQNYALFPHMSVARNVAFGLEERRVPRAEIGMRVAEALAMVKLSGYGDRRITQLSGGQQQRVALARALVIKPQVLLLDEPLSALDKSLRTQMQIEIKQIQRQAGVAAVFVTHDQGEALSLSDRIAVMNAGRIEQIGLPEEIYARPATAFVTSFVGDVNRIPVRVAADGAGDVVLAGPGGTRWRIDRDRLPVFANGHPLTVFVRPEDVLVLDEGPRAASLAPREASLKGSVAAHSYQGSFTHLVVHVPEVEPILVKVPGAQVMSRHPVGSSVSLAPDLARAIVHPAA